MVTDDSACLGLYASSAREGAAAVLAFAAGCNRYAHVMSGRDSQPVSVADGTPSFKVDAFIGRWERSGGSETANFQTFANELCDLLDTQRPNPSQERNEYNDYVYERRIDFKFDDGTTTPVILAQPGCLYSCCLV